MLHDNVLESMGLSDSEYMYCNHLANYGKLVFQKFCRVNVYPKDREGIQI